MSNQDPFGTPPQPPFGQQSPGQQPPYGAQGFGSGPGYPPPPPPKKRTGLIIGAIIAALVVIGGLVVAGVVLLGDDDKSEDTSSESATDEPTDEPTDEESEEPTTEPTEEPTDGGNEVLGTNYTYSLPDEQWTDATADLISAGTEVDSGVIWGESLETARANVLVEALPADGSTIDEAHEQWVTNLESGGGPKLEELPNVLIDGEQSYAVQRQGTNSAGEEIFQTVYLALHQEIVYSISFTSQPADDEAEAGFQAIMDSWAWVS